MLKSIILDGGKFMYKVTLIISFIALLFLVWTALRLFILTMKKVDTAKAKDSFNKAAIIFAVPFAISFVMSITIDHNGIDRIFPANEYSNISTNDLIEKMGKPDNIEKRNNKTANDSFALEAYLYDVDSIHYEFIIADNSVVRAAIYSQNAWEKEGTDFKYEDSKKDIVKAFDIKLNDNAKVLTDTNSAYKISLVSDKIAEFYVSEIDIDNKTYGKVLITYNLSYF